MKQNKLKKQMLMLAATVCTGLSVQASDQMGPDGGAAPGADVPVIAAAPGADQLMATIDLESLKAHTPTPLAPLTTTDGDPLIYTSRVIIGYFKAQLLGADGNGGFFARYSAALIEGERQHITKRLINNILYKLTVILDYDDSDPINPPQILGQLIFATQTPKQRAEVKKLRAILQRAYRTSNTDQVEQGTIDTAWAILIEACSYSPARQINGIETFACILGVDMQPKYFQPDISGHKADIFWAPLYEFKSRMAELAICATITSSHGGIDMHEYNSLRIILHDLIGLALSSTEDPMMELHEQKTAKLLKNFVELFNFDTICAHMLAVFNESPETRARLRAIPQLKKMFHGNDDFKHYAFGEDTPSDQAILEGDTPITKKEMMLYVKVFIGRDGALDESELAVRDSGMAHRAFDQAGPGPQAAPAE